MITKRISVQQKQPGSYILQAEPLSRSYHVAESMQNIQQKLLKMVYIIPNFLVLHFGENFMKI